MSDQARFGKSGLVHWTQIPKETVFCNTNGKTSNTSFNPNVLVNNVPKLCKNVDVHNGHEYGFAKVDNVGLKSENSIKSNPVGSLQELCMARHFPFPVYTYFDENLKKHGARFTVTCSISTYNSSGTGITKQAAKKESAYLMYMQIRKLTSEELSQTNDNKCEYKNETCNYRLYLNYESTTLLKTFFDSKCAPKTPHLQNMEVNSNNFKLTAAGTLKIISEKENFTYECIKISQNSGKVEVLIHLNTSPVVVVLGSGKNENDAQESASRVILTYFKFNI